MSYQLEPETFFEWIRLKVWDSPVIWKTLNPITVTLSDGQKITVPADFETDLSSSPRFLWGSHPPFGAFVKAAIVHDYIYKNDIGRKKMGDQKNKDWADKEMFYLSNVFNPKQPRDNWRRYQAVNIFGKRVYKRIKK